MNGQKGGSAVILSRMKWKALRSLSWLLGGWGRHSLDQRIFVTFSLSAGLTGFLAVLINLLLDFPTAGLVMNFLLAGGLFSFYIVGRRMRSIRPLIWPMIILGLVGLSTLWFLSNGSRGGAQYFFFPAAVMSALLVKGNKRFLIIAAYTIVLGTLFLVEFMFPEFINTDLKGNRLYLSVSLSHILSLLILNVIVLIVITNYFKLMRKIREYKEHLKEDIALAHLMQKQILDIDPELIEGFDLHTIFLPSQDLSGDLYDFSRPREDILRIFLADARGHGINAALSSMVIKSEWLNINHKYRTPATCMELLNSRIMDRYGDNVSCSGVVVDLYRDHIHFASAGHPPQFVARLSGLKQIGATGPMIGYVEESDFQDRELPFQQNDRLFLFTDALTEEMDEFGRPVGAVWVQQCLQESYVSSRQLGQAILNELYRKKGGKEAEFSDDLTMIIVGLNQT